LVVRVITAHNVTTKPYAQALIINFGKKKTRKRKTKLMEGRIKAVVVKV